MWVVADVAVAAAHWGMDHLASKVLRFMTLETELGWISLERKSERRLVRIVTTDALTVSHRCVNVFLKHEVAAFLVASETEFFFLGREGELMINVRDCGMANGAGAGADWAVHPLSGAHGVMAIRTDAVIVGHGRL